MPADESASTRSSLWDGFVDLVVYTPIGLTLDAQDLAPDLARRGRQHTAATRRIGEFAVKAGMRKLDDLVAALDPSAAQSAAIAEDPTIEVGDRRDTPRSDPSSIASAAESDSEPEVSADPDGDPTVPAIDLAIPDYDLLAASQVVKRLDALDPGQLDAIRRHEEAGRGRRTILHKITRLQAG